MKKIFGGVMAVCMLAALAFVPKSSAVTGATLPSNAPTKSIRVIHTIKNVSGRVNTNFKYDFTPKEGNPAHVGGANVDISAGVSSVANDNKEVVSECTINLQNLYFYKVGNYGFTISEKESSDELNFPHDTENKYDIFFQVTNKLDANNEPTGELAVSLLNEAYSYKSDAKVPLKALFESVANYTYISLESKVSGAGADADKYFKYKVDFDGLPNDSVLTISGQDSEVEYNGETIQTVNTQPVSDSDVFVYLKHGQTVTIGDYVSGDIAARELPQGVSYTIEKINDDDGYVTTLDGADATMVSKEVVSVNAEDFATKNITIANNGKDATVNTGIFIATWPYLLAASLGLGGFIVFRRLSRAS